MRFIVPYPMVTVSFLAIDMVWLGIMAERLYPPLDLEMDRIAGTDHWRGFLTSCSRDPNANSSIRSSRD